MLIPSFRCSQLMNATQEDEDTAIVTRSVSKFGRTEVESRLNITKGRYHTLECVATTQGEQAYTLFSISGELYHAHIHHTHTHTLLHIPVMGEI